MRYIAVRTKKNQYKFINTEKLMNQAFNFTVAVLATYGFMDLILRSHGL